MPPSAIRRCTNAMIVGAAFLVAETGTLVVADRGDCLALPGPVIVVAGLDDIVPAWRDRGRSDTAGAAIQRDVR